MSKLTILAILGLLGLIIQDATMVLQGHLSQVDISGLIADITATIAAFHAGKASANTATPPAPVQGPVNK